MNKYVLVTNVGAILFLISCVGSSASAQPMTQSANTTMSGSTNATTSIGSTNLTISQAAQLPIFCPIRGQAPGGSVCITHTVTIPRLIHVGNDIRFEVDVFNDSPHSITVGQGCQAPITARFNPFYVRTTTQFCNIFGLPKVIPAYTTDTVYGPPYTQIYTAIHNTNLLPNVTFAALTFTYHTIGTPGIGHIFWSYPFRIWP
ncbi:MAG: hypothetical protein WA364_00095 [Candidatus Nitrosopolaris sp.]